MIPKKIFSIWLNDSPEPPEIVTKCLETQKKLGYDFVSIALDNCYRGSRYVQECLEAKKWVKASDYLRMYYLYTEGGIYLDADIEMIKPIDDLLDAQLFLAEEKNGCFANSVVGAQAGHPLLKEYLRRLDANFRGDGDLVFEPGLRAFADLVWTRQFPNVTIYPPDYFFPYSSENKEGFITENTRGIHHWLHSWK